MKRLMVSLAPVLATFAVAATLVSWGCADQAELSTPVINCVIRADCGDGFICENQRCVPPPVTDAGIIDLEITPPAGTPFARLQQLNLPIDQLLTINQSVLPLATVYETSISRQDGEAIDARLAIYSQQSIPGRELEFARNVSVRQTEPIQFALNPGAYAVRISPSRSDIPAVEFQDFLVGGRGDKLIKDFELPTEYRRLFGEVTNLVRQETKLADYTVRATALGSGLASTASVTGVDGSYQILLPESADTQFLVEAIAPPAAEAQWSFARVLTIRSDREVRLGVEPVDPAARGRAELQVVGRAQDGSPTPLAGAQVTLTASVASVPQAPVHSVSGTTDASGKVEVTVMGARTTEIPLLQSRYTVTVTPPTGSDMAIHEEVMSFTEVLPSYTLSAQVEVPRLTQVIGGVLYFNEAVAGASVELLSRNLEVAGLTTTTDANGRFTLNVAGGAYLLVVRPAPSRTGEVLAASITEVDVPVDAQGFEFPPVEIPQGRIWQGRVIGSEPGGAIPLANTRVEAFVRSFNRSVSVARAISDVRGEVVLILP